MRVKILITIIIIAVNTQAQTGPGGVGNTDGTSNLVTWYNADALSLANNTSLALWSDSSGNNNNAIGSTTTKPTFSTNAFNGYNAITFDGNDDFLTFSDISKLPLNNDDRTIMLVLQGDGKGTRTIIDYGNNSNGQRFGISSFSNEKVSVAINGARYGNTGTFDAGLRGLTVLLPSGKNKMNELLFYENGYSLTSKRISGTNRTINTKAAGTEIVNNIGKFSTTFFEGKMAEIIFFDKALNKSKRIIVQNYLSAKYDYEIKPSANHYKQDDDSNGNFDHHVAGIGQASDGSKHTDSQGTGIIRISNPSTLVDEGFLFWGENVKNSNYDFSTSESFSYLDRINTQWRVNVRNGGVGTVILRIKASDINLNSSSGCNDLKLIVSDSPTFSTKTTYDLALSLSSETYAATGVSFSDNDYFTIEYKDQIVLDDTQSYNGAGGSNLPNTSDGCYKLLVKSTADGTPSLSEDAVVREVEVESGGKLVVETGHSLKVANAIQLDGDIRLEGSSQLIQTHEGAAAVTGNGNLYIDQNSEIASVYRYNFWSSPVSTPGSGTYTVKGVMKNGATPTAASSSPPDLNFTTDLDGSSSPLTLSSHWIYGYLNSTGYGSWAKKTETSPFNPGEGYTLKAPGVAQNYTFKGTPNDGVYSFTIAANHQSLLGNPYPSALDADSLFGDNSDLEGLYFWEHKGEVSTGVEGHNLGSYIGGYGTRNATMGTAATAATSGAGTAGTRDSTYTAPKRYIPVGQGFFVIASETTAATVVFKNSQRDFVTEAGDSHFFKEKGSSYAILKLGFEARTSDGINTHSQIGISFVKGNTFAHEIGFDSRKIAINSSDIYFQFEGGKPLVIAGVGELSEDMEVPITIQSDTSEELFLMIDEQQNIPENVYLQDKVTEEIIDFSKPIGLFLPKGIYTDRFSLVFKSAEQEYVVSDDFSFYYDSPNNELFIRNRGEEDIKRVVLYNLLGQKMVDVHHSASLAEKKFIIKVKQSLSSSIYILKIETNQKVISKKIGMY